MVDIVREVDEALWAAAKSSTDVPQNALFVIVMNTDARNEFMVAMRDRCRECRLPSVRAREPERYRGAVLAVTHDEEMPRISVFSTSLKAA